MWISWEAALFALALPGNVVTWVKGSGILWGVGALAAAYGVGRAAYGARAGAFAALCLAASGNFAFWSVGGLETSQYVCLILTALYLTMGAGRGFARAAAAAAAWGLAALARPEGIVLGVAVLLYGGAFASRGRARLKFLLAGAVLVAGYGAYFAWRWHYFDMFLPNTYYARAGASPGALISRGRGMLPFLIYAAPAAAFALWRGRKGEKGKGGFVWAAAVTSLILAFAARREWMPGFRYELPFAAALLILVAGAFAAQARTWSRLGAAAGTALILGYVFLPGVFLFRELKYTEGLARAHVALGKWMARASPGESSLAAWDMGAMPYFAESSRVYDINPEGLLSRETTRRGYRPAYFVGQRPSYFVLYSSSAKGPSAPEGHWTWRYYRAEDFAEAYEYLFTFSMREDYHLRLYVLKDLPLSPAAREEGERLARESRVY